MPDDRFRAAAKALPPLLAGVLALSPAAAQPPAGPPAGTPDRAAQVRWQDERFDLARLAPASTAAISQAVVGTDIRLGGGLVGSIEASELERGAAVTLGTISPLYQREASISTRIGVLVDGRTLLFGKVGYSEYNLNQALDGRVSQGRTEGGLLLGAGTEMRVSPDLSVRTQYQSVDYSRTVSDRKLLGSVAWHY